MNFIHQNGYWLAPAALWGLSAAVSSMPEPDQTSGKFYRWAFGFLHAIAGNLDKVSTSIKPPLK
jgi:hypothetical protein